MADVLGSLRQPWPVTILTMVRTRGQRHERMRRSEMPRPWPPGCARCSATPSPSNAHPAQAPEHRRSPAREEPGVGGRQAHQGLRPPDPLGQGLASDRQLTGPPARTHCVAAGSLPKPVVPASSVSRRSRKRRSAPSSVSSLARR